MIPPANGQNERGQHADEASNKRETFEYVEGRRHPPAIIFTARLNLMEQQQDQEDNEDQTDNTGWSIAPAPTVTPSRDDAEQDQNQDVLSDMAAFPPFATG